MEPFELEPFEKVVAEHGPVVMRVCRAVLGSVDAEDAWSETFLSAMRAYPELRPESNVRGWLVTIAYRKAIDQIRTRRRAPLPTQHVPETPSSEDPATLVEKHLPDEELRSALEALPTKQRMAVVAHYVADLPYAQVAVVVDSSEAAARRSAADGIANLRKTYRARVPTTQIPLKGATR